MTANEKIVPQEPGNEEWMASPSAKKSRIRTLKEAVHGIAGLPGWTCWLNDADRMVRVRKPRLVGSPDAIFKTNQVS